MALIKQLGVDEAGERALLARLASKVEDNTNTTSFTPSECAAFRRRLGISFGNWQLMMRCERLRPLFCTVDELKLAENSGQPIELPPEIG